MKAVLISIQPKGCELIASGKKTVEVRKTKPKIETPFKCYIYETQGRTETPWVDEDGHEIFKGRGQVIGEFVCDNITLIRYHEAADGYCVGKPHPFCDFYAERTCLNFDELHNYLKGHNGYGWSIKNLVIYDKPRELGEFTGLHKTKFGYAPYEIKRPFQSWGYLYEDYT